MLDFIFSHITPQMFAWLAVILPMGSFICNGSISIITAGSSEGRFHPLTSIIGTIFPIASFAVIAISFYSLANFESGTFEAMEAGSLIHWIAASDLIADIGIRLDELSLITSLIASGIGALAHIYAISFMDNSAGRARFLAMLSLLTSFAILTALSNNLILTFLGWQGQSLATYLLIGQWFSSEKQISSTNNALVINIAADLTLLAAIFFIYASASAIGAMPDLASLDIGSLQEASPAMMPLAQIICFIIMAAAAIKSAQFPFTIWLTDATAAPTPAIAAILAAGPALAGVSIIARLNFLFILAPRALLILSIIGAVTAIIAAIAALAEADIKRSVSLTAASQLGYIFMSMGIGAFAPAIFHMIVYSIAIALLSFSSGSAILSLAGERNMFKMGGLKSRMPISGWAFIVGAGSLAALAPISGAFSLNQILWQAYGRGHLWLWVTAFIGLGLGSWHLFRAAGLVFFGSANVERDTFKKITEVSVSMALPMLVLITAAIAASLIGIPESIGGSNRISGWLSNLLISEISKSPGDKTFGTERVLITITILWSMHFAILSWVIYSQRRGWAANIAARFTIPYKFIANGLFIDDLVRIAIKHPFEWVCRTIFNRGVSRAIIENFITSSIDRCSSFISEIFSASMDGDLKKLMLYFLLGAAALAGYMAL